MIHRAVTDVFGTVYARVSALLIDVNGHLQVGVGFQIGNLDARLPHTVFDKADEEISQPVSFGGIGKIHLLQFGGVGDDVCAIKTDAADFIQEIKELKK